jgi:hypothetical protein
MAPQIGGMDAKDGRTHPKFNFQLFQHLWNGDPSLHSTASGLLVELSVAQRFGVMSLLFKKNDKTDLQYYRSLIIFM